MKLIKPLPSLRLTRSSIVLLGTYKKSSYSNLNTLVLPLRRYTLPPLRSLHLRHNPDPPGLRFLLTVSEVVEGRRLE